MNSETVDAWNCAQQGIKNISSQSEYSLNISVRFNINISLALNYNVFISIVGMDVCSYVVAACHHISTHMVQVLPSSHFKLLQAIR